MKDTLAGHFWSWFCVPRVWVRYDEQLLISLCLRDYIQRTIFFEGFYERRMVSWLQDELRGDDIFWDIGSNIGAMTLLAARRCHRVVSVEPDPRSLALLQSHVAANRLTNVYVVGAAVCDHDGFVSLAQAPESNIGMSSLCRPAPDWKPYRVSAITADTLVRDQHVPSPNVMKVDVEGAEELVFRGAEALLKDPALRVVAFEAAEGPDGSPRNERLVPVLQRHGFSVSILGRSDNCADDGMQNYLAARRNV